MPGCALPGFSAGPVAAVPSPVDGAEPLFDALVTPNDSGTPQGRALFVGTLAVAFAVSLTACVRLAAWPLAGPPLLVLAFAAWSVWADARRRRQTERIRVWSTRTLVERIDGAGRRTASDWPTGWLRLSMAPDGTLRLGCHGRSDVIGRSLTPPERRELAAALGRHIGPAPYKE